MSQKICRLCLSKDNLSEIFADTAQSDRYSCVLALTTGLRIEPHDGLPQQICTDCTDLVNTTQNFRNQSHLSEIKLLQLGYVRKNTKNKLRTENTSKELSEANKELENYSDDCYDFEGFKIEVELNRITEENGGEVKNQKAKVQSVQPKYKLEQKKNMSVRERRAIYMKLVDGVLDPQEPVKCKVCKKTVSKWACFINHAKKHLGFKFICEFCGKSFISSTQLKRHCRSYHGMARDLKCPHCSYLALDNAQLVVHERRAHTGERPYVCDACGAAYFSRKCLVQHLEGHRATASVQCDKCPQLFKSRRHVARHRYSAHGDKRRARRRERRTAAHQ